MRECVPQRSRLSGGGRPSRPRWMPRGNVARAGRIGVWSRLRWRSAHNVEGGRLVLGSDGIVRTCNLWSLATGHST
eukprot:3678715-Prymnesium_polylepis.1